jgi:hypothetical protein
MPKLWYEKWSPGAAAQDMVARVNLVLDEYAAQGFDLTLRQVYYQCVARGWIPNKQSEYNKLGTLVSRARMAGLIDWSRIVDRTRNLRSLGHYDDPAHVIREARRFFNLDLWADQDFHLEVWIEKDALVGVIQGVSNEQDVSYFSCRGYTSQSEMWGAAQRLLAKIEEGKRVRILHLGDHDPSGIDMTRDIRDRLWRFLVIDYYRNHRDEGVSITDATEHITEMFDVDRLALTMAQVEQYDPPPNPAKTTDSRFEGYMTEYGHESWELDALEPTVMADLIRTAVDGYRDAEKFDAAVAREDEMRKLIGKVSDRWGEVESLLNGQAPPSSGS